MGSHKAMLGQVAIVAVGVLLAGAVLKLLEDTDAARFITRGFGG